LKHLFVFCFFVLLLNVCDVRLVLTPACPHIPRGEKERETERSLPFVAYSDGDAPSTTPESSGS
jgi:hypothetical protein